MPLMPSPTLQSIIQDVLQRVNWEKELAHPGYPQPTEKPFLKQAPPPAAVSLPVAVSPSAVVPPRAVEPPHARPFAPPAQAQVQAQPQPHTQAPPSQTVETSGQGQTRKIEQSRAHALSELKFRLEKCTACRLSESRSRIVFSDGTMSAPIAFVGDAPSRQEDLVSLPFVGERGHLLNKIILAIGQRRENSYLCNVVKCAPAAGQSPSPGEIGTCRQFLFEQLQLVSPKIIVALGQAAASAILDSSATLTSIRGTFHTWQNIPVMPTWSLEDMLATPALKREVWNDMKQVKSFLEQTQS